MLVKVRSGRHGANDGVRHPLGASRRQPGLPGPARRTIGAIRLPRLLRRALWRHLPPRIAPGTHDPTGRPHRQLTAPLRRRAGPARPQRHRRSTRPVAHMPAAGKTAGSTDGGGPSRCRSRLDRTSGTAAGGRGGSRLPTLVRMLHDPGIIDGRVAYTGCPPGNYADRRNVCQTERIALPEPKSSPDLKE